MHIPVLQKEVIKYLDPRPNQNFVDATIGEGGHTTAILEKNGPKGKVLGIELDPELFQKLKKECLKWKFKQRLVLVNDSYTNLEEIAKRENFKNISGALFDLGMSSWHLEKSKRGFSFLRNESLDMRYNPQKQLLTAEKIVNFWSKFEIEKILRDYGEERFAGRITKEIINHRRQRPIKSTFQLVEIIKKAVPIRYQYRKIHFATRTFQALRIAVNDELENLKKVLPQTLQVLEPEGKVCVISFHSLEDRIVKNFLKEEKKFKALTKKPLGPSQEEIKFNPRSRSAKLRSAIKLET